MWGFFPPYPTTIIPIIYAGAVLLSLVAADACPYTLTSLQCQDGARRVFADQAEIGGQRWL